MDADLKTSKSLDTSINTIVRTCHARSKHKTKEKERHWSKSYCNRIQGWHIKISIAFYGTDTMATFLLAASTYINQLNGLTVTNGVARNNISTQMSSLRT